MGRCLIFENFLFHYYQASLKDSKLSNSIHKYNLAVETQDMQYDVGLILSQILQRLGYSCKSESGVANED